MLRELLAVGSVLESVGIPHVILTS
jgi:hypothetical protein